MGGFLTAHTGTRAGILSYLAIAFGMAWIAWEIPIRLGIPVASPRFQLFAVPGAFAPAIAAIMVRSWSAHEGFGDAGLRLNLREWRYFLIAWLLPLAVVAVIAAEAVWFRIGRPDFSMMPAVIALGRGRRVPAYLLPYLRFLIVPQLAINALFLTPVLWGEEFGWRGYLQQRLYPGRPVHAAVATGIIWGVWHYPLILRGYDYPDHPWLGTLLFPVTAILSSIIFGWLRQRSGSIWAPSLAHSATNVIGGSLSVMLFYGAASPTLVGYTGVLAWPPLAALCIWIVRSGQLSPRRVAPAGVETN